MTFDPGASLVDLARPGHEVGGEVTWASWHFDWPLLLPLALVTFFYVRGLRPRAGRRSRHPAWRTACYLLGVATLGLAQESPLHSLADRQFSMHMVQHMLLMMIAVPLILLGAPAAPVLRGMPRTLRRRLVRPLVRSYAVRGVYRALTHPLIALIAITVALWGWHLMPGWYDTSVRNEFVHDLEHASFGWTAVLFWWNVIDPVPLRAALGYVARMLYVLAGATTQGILAAFLSLADRPLYDVYEEARPVFDMSPLADQELGGLIMWIPGQLLHLGVIGVLFAVWAVKSERRQRAEEARLLGGTREQPGPAGGR